MIKCKDYFVFFESDLLNFTTFLTSISPTSVCILVDENTVEKCLPVFFLAFPWLNSSEIIQIPSGETHKNLDTASFIWQKLMLKKADRKALLINLGGGVITDLGAFVASTYKRGINFVQVPTTLLSMVDAAIGGKTGLDFMGEKNMIGTFCFPKAIWINPLFLNTLPISEIKSGVSEMIKHGLIADEKLFYGLARILEKESIYELLNTEYIIRSLEIKLQIVEKDPFENGGRKLLNFGHTIGHAIESFSLKKNEEKESRPLNHGEAIAIGMVCEAYLSTEAGFLSKDTLHKILPTLKRLFPKYPLLPESFEDLWQTILNDKKNESGLANFTFLKKIGEGEINRTAHQEAVFSSFIYFNSILDI